MARKKRKEEPRPDPDQPDWTWDVHPHGTCVCDHAIEDAGETRCFYCRRNGLNIQPTGPKSQGSLFS